MIGYWRASHYVCHKVACAVKTYTHNVLSMIVKIRTLFDLSHEMVEGT